MSTETISARHLRWFLATALWCAVLHCANAAEQRIALVIGNSDYATAPLRNPVNDATAMADKLRSLDFEVILRTNVTQKEMNRAVVQFGQKLISGSVGLFYYAGHGLQVRGKNFLLPVDAEIDNEASVRSESVDVDQVLDQFNYSRLSMVILDACRNNPFERRFRAAISGGLAQIDAPKGTLIAYATAPGKTAADGNGKNGIYTENLLRALDVPGAKVEDVFKRVRIDVARATQDQQIPWEASSLTGEFFFRPVESAASATTDRDSANYEISFWESVKSSSIRADFDAYLERYPRGRFAVLARNRLNALEDTATSARIGTRKQPEKNVETVVQERDKFRPEPGTQTALLTTLGNARPSNPDAYKKEWAARIALLESSKGNLTLAKAIGVLLDIGPGDSALLSQHEGEMKDKPWHNAHAMGVDGDGYVIWGGGYKLRTSSDATESAVERCLSGHGSFCTTVYVNGDFKEQAFTSMARKLGARNVDEVREAYLRTLARKAAESRIGNAAAGHCSGDACFSIGYSSVREK